jgi:hemerythrin-like domain-containing protein
MNAIALLKADHRRLKELFRSYEQLGERAHRSRQRVVEQISQELAVHSNIEETVFYPQVRQLVPKTEDEVLESLEEHHIVKWTLSELEKMHPGDERYNAKVTVLMENVRHHILEEEHEFFPQVARTLSRAELEQIGDELEAARAVAPTRPHPRAPDEPPGNIIAAAASAPIDAVLQGTKTAARRLVRRRG